MKWTMGPPTGLTFKAERFSEFEGRLATVSVIFPLKLIMKARSWSHHGIVMFYRLLGLTFDWLLLSLGTNCSMELSGWHFITEFRLG